jgi:predicted Zn-ribbon and HTH transcriptional regulator
VTYADLDFTKRKPVKCKHCGYPRGEHRAQTFQCPAKWSKGRVGFTHFLETVFEPKETK